MTEGLDSKTRDIVSATMLAYNAMESTKRRHFDYLSRLDAKKKKFNISASASETELLSNMLEDHDHAVRNFKLQSRSLLDNFPAEHQALFKYIALLDQALSLEPESSRH